MVQGSVESFEDPDTHTHSVGSSRHYPIIVIALYIIAKLGLRNPYRKETWGRVQSRVQA